MKKDLSKSSLPIVTLAAVVMGLDYSLGLFFPEWRIVASLNRIVFLGIVLYDIVVRPHKYQSVGLLYIVCLLIFVACLPFLLFVETDKTGPRDTFSEFFAIIGVCTYLLFFYVNCRNTRTASRIFTVLFICSLFTIGYLLGVVFGITGEAEIAWRGMVIYTRASGDFDPNIVMLYLIPCFSFGPLLALHFRAYSGLRKDLLVVAIISISLYAVLQLNSRSGTIVMGATLLLSMFLRLLLSRDRRYSTRVKSVGFVVLMVGSAVFVQVKYGVFDTIFAVFGETHLDTDTSFAYRKVAYAYLYRDLSGMPHFLGSTDGYARFWSLLGVKLNPHCSVVDIYIKGGVLYLLIYCWMYTAVLLSCLRGMRENDDIAGNAVNASAFVFLVGFIPMLVTLSLEDAKMPWGMFGCALGLAAGRSQISSQIKNQRHVSRIEVKETTCPG